MFERKRYGGVMFDGSEYGCKIWRKTNLCFQKGHEKFGKFSPEQVWKYKNLDFSWVLLSKVDNVWPYNLQVGELCVMTVKNEAKFEQELTCQFKTDMMNLTNFNPSTRKSQKFTL